MQGQRQPDSAALRIDHLIFARGQQQRGRGDRRNVRERLRVGRGRGPVERDLGVRILDRQEIVRSCHADPARQLPRNQPDSFQPASVQREHRGVVRARAVTHDVDAIRVDGERQHIVESPFHRQRAVLQEHGIAHFGTQPVIRDDDRRAAGGQRLPDEPVVGAFTARPATAVEKHDERTRAARVERQVDVELLPWMRAVGHTLAAAVAVTGHERVEDAGRGTAREWRGQQGRQAGTAADAWKSCSAVHAFNTPGGRLRFQAARQIFSMLVPPGAPMGSPQVIA